MCVFVTIVDEENRLVEILDALEINFLVHFDCNNISFLLSVPQYRLRNSNKRNRERIRITH